jgi:CheY-like chemotaxis protein
VVYGIVQQHGGHIEVSSKPGKGSTFKIYIPSVDSGALEEPQEEMPAVPGGRETILIAEDDDAVLNVDIRILESLGYNVLTANDGIEAVQRFEEERDKIDLVIIDVVLPKLSGAEVYKKIRSFKPNLRVLFVTGYDVKAELDELVQFEDKDIKIMQKPFTKETFGKAIRDLLDR